MFINSFFLNIVAVNFRTLVIKTSICNYNAGINMHDSICHTQLEYHYKIMVM